MNAPAVVTVFLPLTPAVRLRLEATIEALVALLDLVDGDADFEPANDDEDGGDAEDGGDLEPWLGWTAARHGMGPSSNDNDDDREAG